MALGHELYRRLSQSALSHALEPIYNRVYSLPNIIGRAPPISSSSWLWAIHSTVTSALAFSPFIPVAF